MDFARWIDARAVGLEAIPGGVSQQPLGHLAPRGVLGAQEQHLLLPRHLEIGCGAANALLSLLAALPKLSAVGVEIDGGAVALARRRARELGVEDRVELRHADARDLGEETSFDSADWSQQFFPAEGREEVLAALRALKPGGYLLTTMFGDPPESAEALREPAGRSYALDRLAYGGWGVPVLGVEELREQVEGAGFEVLRRTSKPANPLMVSRGIMLARRLKT